MKISNVNILNIDDSVDFLHPTRSLRIRTTDGYFDTPNRSVTSYEYNRKKNIPSEFSIENKTSIYSKKFSAGDISRLINSNDEFSKQVIGIERANSSAQYSILQLSSFSIAKTALRGPNPYEILSSDRNLDSFVSSIIDMQIEAGNDMISIPQMNLDFTRLTELYRRINRTLEKLDKQPIFNLDLKYEYFIPLLYFVYDNFSPLLINLTYGRYRDFRLHYKYLEKYADKDIAFILSNIERMDENHFNLSTMHYMPFLGSDLYAVDLPAPNIPVKGKPKKEKNLTNLKILNSNDMTFSPINTYQQPLDFILDQLEGTDNQMLQNIITNIPEAKYDEQKYDILNALTRVYELKVSSDEFNSLQNHIINKSSIDYVNDKKSFESRLRVIG